MGLRSKLNKMKSFLFDEEEDEKEIKKTPKISLKKDIKKEKIKEEQDDFSKTQEIEELYFEDVSENSIEKTKEIKSRATKIEPEFKFPEFNDDDFAVVRTKPEPIIKPVREEVKPVLYQGSKRKEETKKFKPSPIISPIYGLLDKDGNTIQNDSKSHDGSSQKEEVSLDIVRKKAYGALDEELENTMKRLSKKTIEEAEKDMEVEEKELSRTKQKAKKVEETKPVVISKEDLEADDDDDMILPNINFKEIDVDKERLKNNSGKKSVKENIEKQLDDDDDDDDTKEQDLFNLIDSMYQKEGKED